MVLFKVTFPMMQIETFPSFLLHKCVLIYSFVDPHSFFQLLFLLPTLIIGPQSFMCVNFTVTECKHSFMNYTHISVFVVLADNLQLSSPDLWYLSCINAHQLFGKSIFGRILQSLFSLNFSVLPKT